MSLTDVNPAEVELKLAIGSETAHAVANREVGRAAARSVETIYFDTPRRRLQAAGYNFRLRRDGERWSQSVKASTGFSRYEQEIPLPAAMPDFSFLEGTPLAALVGQDGRPSPVFVTRVTRRTCKRDVQNSHLELSLDEGEVIVPDRSWPILELELELKAGEPTALFDTGRRLAEGADFVPDFMSKAERGFALADGMLGEPVRFGVQALDPEAGAINAFQVLARRCLRQLTLNAELISDGASLEATHQARTALRRLRVAIRLFQSLLDPARVGRVKDELRWITGELGPARNLDVIIEDIFQSQAHQLADRKAAAAFGHLLIRAQEEAHDRARMALASPRYRLLLIDLAHWIETCLRSMASPDAPEPQTADFARHALEHRRHALLRRLKKLDWDDARARHKGRIAAKKMRYASEFFVDLGPKARRDDYRPFLKALARLQDRLGGLNDLAVAEGLTLSLLADEDRAIAYAAGLIVGRNAAMSDKLVRKARREAHAFEKAPLWW